VPTKTGTGPPLFNSRSILILAPILPQKPPKHALSVCSCMCTRLRMFLVRGYRVLWKLYLSFISANAGQVGTVAY